MHLQFAQNNGQYIFQYGDNGFHQIIIFNNIAEGIALAAFRIVCEDGRTVMRLRDATAEMRIHLHLCYVVRHKQKIAAAYTLDNSDLLTDIKVGIKDTVENFILVPNFLASVFQLFL